MNQSELDALREAARKAIKNKPKYDPNEGDKLESGDVLVILHPKEVNWIADQAYAVLEGFQADKSSYSKDTVKIALNLIRHIEADETE